MLFRLCAVSVPHPGNIRSFRMPAYSTAAAVPANAHEHGSTLSRAAEGSRSCHLPAALGPSVGDGMRRLQGAAKRSRFEA